MFCIPIDAYQWLDLILKFGIASAASMIAYQQYKVGRDKLRYDLFEKRFALYNSLYESLLSVIGERPNQIEFTENVRITREAQFLFGKEVGDYIAGLNKTIQKYILHHNRADSMNKAFRDGRGDHPDRDKENEADDKLRTELVNHLDTLANVFHSYLRMDHKAL